MTRQERTRRASRLSPVEPLETRNLMTIAATAPLPALNLATGAAVAPVNLDSYFKDANASADYAMVNTSLGTIPVLLTPQTTPLTVANFENYVAKGSYTNTIVHRSVPGFIWQTGGYQLSASGSASEIATDAPVKNEFSASNVRGTVAMAKLGSDPNSATSQFFFNESDSNAANLDNQNGGFTVFGHVVGDQGLAVMDAVAAVPVPSPAPLSSPLDEIPLQNYTTGASVQPANLVLIKSVTMANELYTTTTDTPGVATATVTGSNLTVTPVAAGTAHITVVGYGSDGKSATESFTVNVTGAAQPVATTTPPTGTTTTTTATPTATPTSTPTPTIPTTTIDLPGDAVPPSVLTPIARGQVPAAVVVGRKVKIQQTVILADAATTVAQRETVALKLSTTTTDAGTSLTIATAAPKVKLKAGQQAKVSLTATHLGASMQSGTYHVLVSVTDPDGGVTTVDTGKTIQVTNPREAVATTDQAILR